MRMFLSIALVLSLTFVAKAYPAEGVVKFTHLWISSDGKSHLKHCEVQNMDKSDDFGTPQYVKDLNGLITPSNIILTQMVGENPWHKSPLTQFVTVLDGAWYVNTTDGDSIVMERGHVLFQEDSEANPVGAEHYSGSAFEHPCNQMVVQTEASPIVDNDTCNWVSHFMGAIKV